MRDWRTPAALGLILLAALPPFRGWWEELMVRHMLGQIPLLVAAGVLLAPLLARLAERLNGRRPATPLSGAALLLVASFCLGFWMLPRWLDAAVNEVGADAAKMLSLVLLAGVPLGLGWPRLGAVGRAFLWNQLVSMLLILGVLYIGFPQRLCNNYLVDEQLLLGWLMLALAAAIGLWAGARVLFAGLRRPNSRVNSRIMADHAHPERLQRPGD